MNDDLKTSQEGISLIKSFEGCELTAYLCSAGVPTLGFGHTRDVSMGDTCTQEEAESMLAEDLVEFEDYVKKYVETDLQQNEFDALADRDWETSLVCPNPKVGTPAEHLYAVNSQPSNDLIRDMPS